MLKKIPAEELRRTEASATPSSASAKITGHIISSFEQNYGAKIRDAMFAQSSAARASEQIKLEEDEH
jgi:hypothetical protein